MTSIGLIQSVDLIARLLGGKGIAPANYCYRTYYMSGVSFGRRIATKLSSVGRDSRNGNIARSPHADAMRASG